MKHDVQQLSDYMKLTKQCVHRLKQEWPTWLLIFACNGAFLLTLLFSSYWPTVLSVTVLSFVLVLHSSLQHEALHGHPSSNPLFNELLMLWPVGLLIPYRRFRDTHLAHHHDESLTDPYDDPETAYLDPSQWRLLSKPVKALLSFNNTFVGRLLVGPVIGMAWFYASEMRALINNEHGVRSAWLIHLIALALLAPIIVWLWAPGLLAYAISCYLSMSILKIRTFGEHKAHSEINARTAVIESKGILGFLFLYNNYHSVHHRHPTMPWYRLPHVFEKQQSFWLERNCHNHYSSYGNIIKRYLLTQREPVAHPLKVQSADTLNNASRKMLNTT